MAYLISILLSLALLIGFFALTWFEERRGARVFAEERTRFDQTIARIEFIWNHVDFGAFVKDEVHRFATSIGHDTVQFTLHTVRSIERVLTRLARYFRAQRAAVDVVPRESSRTFVKTLNDFKGRLKATHPKVSDITAVEAK
ncbi:MAG: hypothetical protein WAN50_04555 [Minisyncoccia bacterium]